MRNPESYQPEGASANAEEYQPAFVLWAHRLLALGHGGLVPRDYALAEEENITGSLVEAMEAALDRPEAPWMRWLSVHEDARVHDVARKGKRRRRVDIRIDCARTRPRSRLYFEAKRLGRGHGVSLYLGEDGLECFVDGRYAAREPIAGMLGYVQDGSPQQWARKISQAMSRSTSPARPLRRSPWRKEEIIAELPHTYRSGHARPTIGQPVEIYHTLLLFSEV